MATPFRIHTEPVGTPLVEIDGRPFTTGVRALTVTAGGDEPTRLTVELAPGAGPIEGEGIVEVVRDVTGGDAVRCLDPQAIQAQVLRQAGMGSSTAALYLDVIAGMLDAQVEP